MEHAAVELAVRNHSFAAPENVFCPFTIPSRDGTGALARASSPLVHWGNVDTGSMVNIVYQGALTLHPSLHAYHHPYSHQVKGVGGCTVAVIGKLQQVPVSLGKGQSAGSCFKTDFFVLDCPGYHFILGLALLRPIDGVV